MYSFLRKLLSVFTLAVILSGKSFGDSSVVSDHLPYSSGMLAVFGPPLSYFSPPSLNKACLRLQAGDINSARDIFQKYSNEDPTNLAAWVGYIQCQRNTWSSLLSEYSSLDQALPSPVNDFKAGLVAWYIEATGSYPKNYTFNDRHALQVFAGAKLLKVLRETRNPIVAFTIHDICLETFISYYAGSNAYSTYTFAKDNGWDSPIPNVINTGSKDLNLLTWIIQDLYDQNSCVANVETHPKDAEPNVIYFAPGQLSTQQLSARNWLRTWGNAVCDQIRKDGGKPEFKHISWNSAE